MSILKNACDSIAIGLEDYTSEDPRRIISCTRNLFAGILLLFKYKLSLMSPIGSDEVLIKQDVLPVIDKNNLVEWKGKGSKTVDVKAIQDRFKSLNVEVDWKRIEKINKFRNDIEHYFSNLSHESIQSLISDSFIIINDFIKNHLNEDPKELLGNSAWAVLIKANEVYENEKAGCTSALESLDYFDNEILSALEEFYCNDCGSGLIMPSIHNGDAINANFICKACGKTLSYDEILIDAVSDHYDWEIYLSHTDGGDSPLAHCPECGGTYLYEKHICASCGLKAEHKCKRCGSTIGPEELPTSPFCGYCSHMMSKDD